MTVGKKAFGSSLEISEFALFCILNSQKLRETWTTKQLIDSKLFPKTENSTTKQVNQQIRSVLFRSIHWPCTFNDFYCSELGKTKIIIIKYSKLRWPATGGYMHLQASSVYAYLFRLNSQLMKISHFLPFNSNHESRA